MSFPWDHLPPAHRDAIERGDAADAAREKEEAIARADQEWDRQFRAEHEANLIEYQTGHSASEWRQAAARVATAREGRNPLAEWGSEQRSAVFVDGQELAPIEQARAGSLARDVLPGEKLLSRARLAGASEFMRAEVARFDQRRGGKPVISRSEGQADGVACLDCIEQHASPEESFMLHHDPDDPLPERHVPDHAPSRSSRRRTPMIYR